MVLTDLDPEQRRVAGAPHLGRGAAAGDAGRRACALLILQSGPLAGGENEMSGKAHQDRRVTHEQPKGKCREAAAAGAAGGKSRSCASLPGTVVGMFAVPALVALGLPQPAPAQTFDDASSQPCSRSAQISPVEPTSSGNTWIKSRPACVEGIYAGRGGLGGPCHGVAAGGRTSDRATPAGGARVRGAQAGSQCHAGDLRLVPT